MPTRHELKTWPEFFVALWERRKTFEIRKNDRDYQVGDELILRKWSPKDEKYSGAVLGRKISYVMEGGKFGLEPGYVVLALVDYDP